MISINNKETKAVPVKRRNLLNYEIEQLEKNLPFNNFTSSKISKLRVLKATCAYLKKQRHFLNLKNKNKYFDMFSLEEEYGFLICFSKNGEIVFISETIFEYLGFFAMDILLTHDSIFELICDQDINAFKKLIENYNDNSNKLTLFSNWFVSKIKRKNVPKSEFKLLKMNGQYDLVTELFIFNCQPVISKPNREICMLNDPNCFKTLLKLNLDIFDLDSNASNLLEYECYEQRKLNLYHILTHESLKVVTERHRELLKSKATTQYLDHVQLISKNGFVLNCLINLHINNKGFIIANFQLMSYSDIEKYNEYVTTINLSTLTKTHEILDFDEMDEIDSGIKDNGETEDIENRNFLNTMETSKIVGSCKRKYKTEIDEDNFNLEKKKSKKSITKSKASKIKEEMNVNVKIEPDTQEVAETEIFSIKNKLIDEVKYLDSCWSLIEKLESVDPIKEEKNNPSFDELHISEANDYHIEQSSIESHLSEDKMIIFHEAISDDYLDYEEENLDENLLEKYLNLMHNETDYDTYQNEDIADFKKIDNSQNTIYNNECEINYNNDHEINACLSPDNYFNDYFYNDNNNFIINDLELI